MKDEQARLYGDDPLFGDDQRKAYCPHCKKETFQTTQFCDPDFPEKGEYWMCEVCCEAIEITEKP